MLSHEALSATEARLGWEGTGWRSLGAGIWAALLGTGKAPAFCSSHLQEGKGSLWAGVRPAGVLPTDGDRQDLGAHRLTSLTVMYWAHPLTPNGNSCGPWPSLPRFPGIILVEPREVCWRLV